MSDIEQEVAEILNDSKRIEEIDNIVGSLCGISDQLRDLIVIPVWKNNGARVWHTGNKNQTIAILEIMKAILVKGQIRCAVDDEEDENDG